MRKTAFICFSTVMVGFSLDVLPSLAQSFFSVPPLKINIHNPQSIEGRKNRTTISVLVPENAGASLRKIVLDQLPNIDTWDWGTQPPRVYTGLYSLRGKGRDGLATAELINDENTLMLSLDPAIDPGEQVNVVMRGFNPDASVYQWRTGLVPDGENPVTYQGPILRLNIYKYPHR